MFLRLAFLSLLFLNQWIKPGDVFVHGFIKSYEVRRNVNNFRNKNLITTTATAIYVYKSYKYEEQQLSREFHRSGGILYKKSILKDKELDVIRSELSNLLSSSFSVKSKPKQKKPRANNESPLPMILNDETTSSVAINRVGAKLPWDCQTIQVLENPEGSLSQLLNDIIEEDDVLEDKKSKMILSRDVPVEVRVYEKMGSGMEWHRDDILFTKPQIEVVLTLENTSDCRTMWEVEKEEDQKTIITRKEVETDVNSALFIKAGGVSHKVSSLKYGRRVILKFVYVAEDGEILRDAIKHTQQFSGSKSKEKKKKKKR